MFTFTARKIIVLAILLVFGLTSIAFAQAGASRSDCKKKSAATLKNLDNKLGEYNKEMGLAPKADKAKYVEWIRELKKLKQLVKEADDKLNNSESCSSDDCVESQCNLVIIAEKQIGSLHKEREKQLGGSGARFGEGTGKETIVDQEEVGDDTIIPEPDPADAYVPSTGQESEQTDNPPPTPEDSPVDSGTDNTGDSGQSPPTPPIPNGTVL